MTKGQNILAALIIVAFSVITVAAFMTELLKDIRSEIVMAWVINFGIVINYRFGSSQGSSDKTKIIEQKLNGK